MNTITQSRPVTRLVAALTAFLLGAGAVSAWDSYQIDLPSGSKESLWRDALAEKVGGITEQKIQAGRIDVATDREVFEVDRPNKWKEGMGQVLAYAGETGKKPVLALMSYSRGPANLQAKSKATFDLAEKECSRHGVRLLILFPMQPERPHVHPTAPSAVR